MASTYQEPLQLPSTSPAITRDLLEGANFGAETTPVAQRDAALRLTAETVRREGLSVAFDKLRAAGVNDKVITALSIPDNSTAQSNRGSKGQTSQGSQREGGSEPIAQDRADALDAETPVTEAGKAQKEGEGQQGLGAVTSIGPGTEKQGDGVKVQAATVNSAQVANRDLGSEREATGPERSSRTEVAKSESGPKEFRTGPTINLTASVGNPEFRNVLATRIMGLHSGPNASGPGTTTANDRRTISLEPSGKMGTISNQNMIDLGTNYPAETEGELIPA